jgi:hypothetical protein
MPTETKYEQLYEQRHTGITCVIGPITPAVVDKLQDEIATIAATTKTYSYPQGQLLVVDSLYCITRSINPHKVTAMTSTLERLIVDY